ncbi:MAG: hypothetical protein QXW35_03640 [Candidatus Aenigmatarchaeota archaeon]
MLDIFLRHLASLYGDADILSIYSQGNTIYHNTLTDNKIILSDDCSYYVINSEFRNITNKIPCPCKDKPHIIYDVDKVIAYRLYGIKFNPKYYKNVSIFNSSKNSLYRLVWDDFNASELYPFITLLKKLPIEYLQNYIFLDFIPIPKF